MSEMLPKLGTIDRYFSDKIEQRIGRVSFLLRMLTMVILILLSSMALNMIIIQGLVAVLGFGAMQFMMAPLIVSAIVTLFALFSFPMLISKRSHDFNADAKIFVWFTRGVIILNMISMIDASYQLYIGNLFNPSMFSTLISYASYISYILFILLFLYLLFRPGTVGSNNYGEAK